MFRGGVVAKRQLLLSATRAADEVRCRVIEVLMCCSEPAAVWDACLTSNPLSVHGVSTQPCVGGWRCLRAALLLLRVSLSNQISASGGREHVKLAGARRCEWQHAIGIGMDTGWCDEAVVYDSSSQKHTPHAAVRRSATEPGVGDRLHALLRRRSSIRVACSEAAFLRCMFLMAAL